MSLMLKILLRFTLTFLATLFLIINKSLLLNSIGIRLSVNQLHKPRGNILCYDNRLNHYRCVIAIHLFCSWRLIYNHRCM